jgi:hypothetical protein
MSVASKSFHDNNIIQPLYDESDSDIELELEILDKKNSVNIYTIKYNDSEDESENTSLSSSNNLSFSLTEKQLHYSGLLISMKECPDADNKIFYISTSYMNKYSFSRCMEYLIYHEDREIELPLKPLRSKIFSELWKDIWDVEFIEQIYRESDQSDKLYELVNAANYLDIKPLIFLTLSKLAHIAKNAKYPEIDDLLGLNKI